MTSKGTGCPKCGAPTQPEVRSYDNRSVEVVLYTVCTKKPECDYENGPFRL